MSDNVNRDIQDAIRAAKRFRIKNKMGETIAYAIQKECSRYSLVEWCEEWGFTIEDFEKFLEAGKKEFEEN